LPRIPPEGSPKQIDFPVENKTKGGGKEAGKGGKEGKKKSFKLSSFALGDNFHDVQHLPQVLYSLALIWTTGFVSENLMNPMEATGKHETVHVPAMAPFTSAPSWPYEKVLPPQQNGRPFSNSAQL
jgi:hypothetical protein